MNLCVIGTGYVGLVTGACLADLGHTVVCVDRDQSKIDKLRQGVLPIFEPGLDEMVKRNVAEWRLLFLDDVPEGVRRADVVFITVGTGPSGDCKSSVSAVRDCAVTIARSLDRYKVIVNKSTVPVGTGDLVHEVIDAGKVDPDVAFDVVSNPEFLREGSAISDTLHPDRIVIGASNQDAAARVIELYAPLECPMIVTDIHTAEMIKHASNAFLATKISFINAIATLCEATGTDVAQVAKGMGYDKRIGDQFLQAGLGYGGSCLGKDAACLIQSSDGLGYDFRLLKSVVEVNAAQPRRFVEKIARVLGSLQGKTIAVLGLAFKPCTGDMRDARSLDVISGLLAQGARVRAYDPVAMDNARAVFPQIDYCDSAYQAAESADAVALVTEWNEFKFLDLARVKETLRQPIMFDGRNLYDTELMRRLGFDYHCVGRPSVVRADK